MLSVNLEFSNTKLETYLQALWEVVSKMPFSVTQAATAFPSG